MTVLTLLYPMTPITTPPSTSQQQQQQQQKIPLRRATYIHISDLTSAYNIDNVQLEKEMARVNAKRNKIHDASNDNNDQDEGSKKNAFKTDTPADDDPENLEAALGPIVPQKRLQPPRGGFNLCVLVGKINLVVDKRRVDRSRVRLAEVEIGDETGTVSLRARDEQIDLLERVSKCKPGAVVLRNCTLELYQGKHIRLAVTKWGKLSEYPDDVASTPGPPPIMNLDRNFSLIDLSLVASEIIEKKPKESTLQSHSSASRQTKTSEGEKASGSSSSSKTQSTLKSGQQTHTKHQQSQSQSQSQTSRRGSNRSSNERRQSQSRGSHYGGMTTETNQNQPPRQQGQVVYHGGIQGYHGYEQHHQQQQQQQQSIDMRMRQQQQQYPPTSYAHSTRAQQDVVSAQYALRQQYEMQQRQLHQLYSREQNRQSGQAQMLLRPISSFEASTGSYAGNIPEHHQHQMMTGVGNSPMMVGTPSSPEIGRTSPFVIGQMNPEAMSYAPSYQGSNPQQQVSPVACPPQYNYDPSPGHHHTFYAPGGVTPGATMYPHTPQTSLNPPMDQEGKASTESAPKGKENVTSKS